MDSTAQNTSEAPSAAETIGVRKVALYILGQVLDRHQALDNVLETYSDFLELPGRDKAFIRMMVATTLRRLGQLDDFIQRGSKKKEPPTPPQLHNLLRMAATQIAFMNVPDYAVVDTAVRLAEECEMSRQKGFVNAVLRRVAENHKDWISKQDETRINTPEWLMKLWIADYDLRTAAEIAQANLSEASLDISIKAPDKTEALLKTLEAALLPTGSLRRPAGGIVHKLPGFDDGLWWIQDASAALPARLFGDIDGKHVLDICAAPGGKTAQLASMGAQVTALDRSVGRLRKLQENMHRLGLEDHVTTEITDGAIWKPKAPLDYILLDAPCSATGTVRRHPDILHLKMQKDIDRLTEVQMRLLENSASILASGGVLVYCTCSLQKAEGEYQIEAFLAKHKDMQRLPVKANEVGGLEAIVTNTGDVRILPFHMATHGGMDGFYIARLQKK